MITKELGKIERVSFGHGGYQDVCFGLTLSFILGKNGSSVIPAAILSATLQFIKE